MDKLNDMSVFNCGGEFLLIEYGKTCDMLELNYLQYDKIVKFYIVFSMGMLSIAGFMIKEKIIYSGAVSEASTMSMLLFLYIPFMSIVCGVYSLFYVVMLRNRDAWCYNRLNMVRKIILNNSGNDYCEEYINSRYGKVSAFVFSEKTLFKHIWYKCAQAISIIIIGWSSFLFYVFFSKNISILAFSLMIVLVSFFSKKMYLKLFNLVGINVIRS